MYKFKNVQEVPSSHDPQDTDPFTRKPWLLEDTGLSHLPSTRKPGSSLVEDDKGEGMEESGSEGLDDLVRREGGYFDGVECVCIVSQFLILWFKFRSILRISLITTGLTPVHQFLLTVHVLQSHSFWTCSRTPLKGLWQDRSRAYDRLDQPS